LCAIVLRPLLQHARPLPDGQPDARPVLDCRFKHGLSPKKTVASIKHALDLAAVLSPLLDLEVVAVVGDQRLVGFFVRQIAHHGAASLSPVYKRIRVRPRLGAKQLGQLGDIGRDPASLVAGQ
jgi:hypothetical protein